MVWIIAFLVTLAGASVSAITYFATRSDLNKLECLGNHNLLRRTLPIHITLLETTLKLSQSELKDVVQGTPAAIAKSAEIVRYSEELKASREKYDQLPQYTIGTCENEGRK